MVLSEHESALQVLIDKQVSDLNASTIIYGSHFAEDRIKLSMYHNFDYQNCMEAGHTIVLMHLDEIYESLFNAQPGLHKGCCWGSVLPVAIGARSRQCEVHKSFRCIVVVDSERAYAIASHC